jgi:hypothetical protein
MYEQALQHIASDEGEAAAELLSQVLEEPFWEEHQGRHAEAALPVQQRQNAVPPYVSQQQSRYVAISSACIVDRNVQVRHGPHTGPDPCDAA